MARKWSKMVRTCSGNVRTWFKIIRKWSKMVRKCQEMIQDGQEMFNKSQEMFRIWSGKSGNGKEGPGNGQEMSRYCLKLTTKREGKNIVFICPA